MVDEARFNIGVQITKGHIQYRSLPTTFTADVDGTAGPTPGYVLVATSGTDIDLSGLGTPGICVLHNIDPTNYVEYGVGDGSSTYELGEIQPGEIYVLRLARSLTTLRMQANTAPVRVVVEAFEA